MPTSQPVVVTRMPASGNFTGGVFAQVDGRFLGTLPDLGTGGPGTTSLALDPITNHIWTIQNTAGGFAAFQLDPTAGYLTISSFVLTVPTGIFFDPTMIRIAGGFVYVLWVGFAGQTTHHELQRYALGGGAPLHVWTDFNATALANAGISLRGGCFSLDGSIFYYGISGGAAQPGVQNNLYAFNVTTAVNTLFATYGTWIGAPATGNTFSDNSFCVNSLGQLVAATLHETAGVIDGHEILVFSALGVLLDHWTPTDTNPGGHDAITGLIMNGATLWIAWLNNALQSYDLVSHAIGVNIFFSDRYGDDLIAMVMGCPACPPPPPGNGNNLNLIIGLPPMIGGGPFSIFGDEDTMQTQERFPTHQTLTVDNMTAQGFTITDEAIGIVFLTVDGADIRFFMNGDLPTTSNGHFIANGTPFQIAGRENIRLFKVIATTAGPATVVGSFGRP